MTPPEIALKVRGFITTNFYVPSPDALLDDASLLDQGMVDSTGVLEVVAFLEEAFTVKIADDEMVPDNLDSITRIAAFVARKTAS